jgi:hypothetical protein
VFEQAGSLSHADVYLTTQVKPLAVNGALLAQLIQETGQIDPHGADNDFLPSRSAIGCHREPFPFASLRASAHFAQDKFHNMTPPIIYTQVSLLKNETHLRNPVC